MDALDPDEDDEATAAMNIEPEVDGVPDDGEDADDPANAGGWVAPRAGTAIAAAPFITAA